MIDTRDSSLFGTRNPMEGEVRIPSGCAIAGIFHKKGGKIGGDTIIRAMEPMHDRSNGLGGGFAAYGPILQGLNAPINDLSRGCDAEEVYQMSIITAALD